MNFRKYIALALTAMALIACDKDDSSDDGTTPPVPEYTVHIHSPNTDNKHVGDTIHIMVEVESTSGGTIHNVAVHMKNKGTNDEVFRMPTDHHVHADSAYHFHDMFILDSANGVTGHTNWILKAEAWGHETNAEVISDMVEFHVHP